MYANVILTTVGVDVSTYYFYLSIIKICLHVHAYLSALSRRYLRLGKIQLLSLASEKWSRNCDNDSSNSRRKYSRARNAYSVGECIRFCLFCCFRYRLVAQHSAVSWLPPHPTFPTPPLFAINASCLVLRRCVMYECLCMRMRMCVYVSDV